MATQGDPSGRSRPSLVRKVRDTVRREGLFPPGSSTLVMVSGGQDSVALLHLLGSGALGKDGPASVHVLHVNHHLRGDESDADEALVAGLCARLQVGLTVVHSPIDKSKGNVQEVAREARRAAALQTALSMGCERIAVGHTADDQVETLFYRMGRYAGVSALVGMSTCDPPWVRPLLQCRRRETEYYCAEHGLEFACDKGNAYPGYARTGIRERVLPAWEAALPGAVGAACRTAEVAAEVKEVADMVVAEAAALVRASSPGHGPDDALRVSGLLAMPAPVRRLLLHHWLGERTNDASTRAGALAVESLLGVPGSARRSLGGGWRAVKEYGLVWLEPTAQEKVAVPEPVSLSVPGMAAWDGATVVVEAVPGFHAVDVEREAIVDAACVDGLLSVRGPRPGDKLRPLGALGSRKLKEILIDLKIPARERARRPLVVCGERILWVCGLVVAEEARVTRDTTRFLRFSYERGENGAAV